MMTRPLATLSDNKIIWLLTAIAGLIAWRIMYIQHGWINDDSTLYFEIAKRFSVGKWREGWELFQWPFYPLLIAIIHKTTSINLHLSAQILAVLFYCFTAFSLSKLIQLAGGDKLVILCGNLLLFSSTYITGDVFAMLLRDQGFWAFFLTSIVFFIRYIRDYRIQDAVFWQVCIIIATLFRVEGATYAFFLPFILLTQPLSWGVNIKHVIKANLIHLALLTIIIVAIFAVNTINASHLGRLNEITSLFSNNNSTSFNSAFIEKSDVYASEVLGSFLGDYAPFGLLITLLSIVAIKCFKVAGSLSSLLILAGRKRLFTLPAPDAQKVLLATATIAILNANFIIFRSFVLSSRYVIAFGFLVIIFVAFYLASVIRAWQNKQTNTKLQSFLLIISVALISAGLIKNLANKREDYNYEQHAIAWAKQNTNTTDLIYYDNARLRYYANAPWSGRNGDTDVPLLLEHLKNNAQPYRCLVLRTEADENEKLRQIQLIPDYHQVKKFSNKSGNQVHVLCRNHVN